MITNQERASFPDSLTSLVSFRGSMTSLVIFSNNFSLVLIVNIFLFNLFIYLLIYLVYFLRQEHVLELTL